MTRRRVVITGMGVVSPLGSDLEQHTAQYRAGSSGVVACDPSQDLIARRAPVSDFGLSQQIGNRMLRKLLQRTAVMAVISAGAAIRDAGLDGSDGVLERAGLYVGAVSFDVSESQFLPALDVSVNDAGEFDIRRFATRGVPQIDPLLIVKGLPNAGLCGIAIEHRVLGPNLNISSGSAGGLEALMLAAESIRQGELDVAIAGAYDSLLQPAHVAAELLAGRATPPGEGAVMWVLEDEDHARRRGARVYAAIEGVEESGQSLEIAVRRLLDNFADGRPLRVHGDLFDTTGHELRLARSLLRDDATVHSPIEAIGFAGAAHALFSGTHAVLEISDGTVPSAMVWHSDGEHRHVAMLLTS